MHATVVPAWLIPPHTRQNDVKATAEPTCDPQHSKAQGLQTAHLHLCSLLGMTVEAFGLDGLQPLGFLLMGKQQAAHLGQPLPPLLCLLHSQSLSSKSQKRQDLCHRHHAPCQPMKLCTKRLLASNPMLCPSAWQHHICMKLRCQAQISTLYKAVMQHL